MLNHSEHIRRWKARVKTRSPSTTDIASLIYKQREMKSVLSVKMLAALALVLLVSSVTEGRILSKCELKDNLVAALGGNVSPVVVSTTPAAVDVTEADPVAVNVTVPVTVPVTATVDLGLIARIICSVKHLSKFNTNQVTLIQSDVRPPVGPPPRPGRPGGRPGGRPNHGHPGGRGKRSPGRRHDSSSEEDSFERPTRVPTTLYGIFQLSNRVACSSGTVQSLNICRMDCSALIDDDIRDDIACLKTLLNSVNNARPLLFVKDCLNVNPLLYFAKCV